MKIKHPFLFALLLIVGMYIIYKLVTYEISNSQMTYDKAPPQIKMSQLVGISEDRIRYSQNYYVKKNFVGFNAFIDKDYFITVTKLGKIVNDFKLIKTLKRPDNDSDILPFVLSDFEDQNSRYINQDLSLYPFNTQRIYYYIEGGNIININQSEFYEMEATFSFFNLSFKGENRKDFGYVGSNKKKSISFIQYKGDLYIINLFPIGKTQYKSLHDLYSGK